MSPLLTVAPKDDETEKSRKKAAKHNFLTIKFIFNPQFSLFFLLNISR